MKMKMTIVAIALLALVTTVHAQETDESRIKILPAGNSRMIKLLYAMELNEPLQVKFFNANGEIASDLIKGNYSKGILKRYDVKSINTKDFWVEVSTSRGSVTYRVTPSKDTNGLISRLEKTTTYNQVLVRKNN
jgi:hypothetical protein